MDFYYRNYCGGCDEPVILQPRKRPPSPKDLGGPRTPISVNNNVAHLAFRLGRLSSNYFHQVRANLICGELFPLLGRVHPRFDSRCVPADTKHAARVTFYIDANGEIGM